MHPEKQLVRAWRTESGVPRLGAGPRAKGTGPALPAGESRPAVEGDLRPHMLSIVTSHPPAAAAGLMQVCGRGGHVQDCRSRQAGQTALRPHLAARACYGPQGLLKAAPEAEEARGDWYTQGPALPPTDDSGRWAGQLPAAVGRLTPATHAGPTCQHVLHGCPLLQGCLQLSSCQSPGPRLHPRPVL